MPKEQAPTRAGLLRQSGTVIAALAFSASPAIADMAMDRQCVLLSQSIRAEAQQCGMSSEPPSVVQRCLAPRVAELNQAATTCINAAQDHFDAGYGLSGYAADHELLGAATMLGVAAFANFYLGHRDLAVSQLHSTLKIASQVRDDPDAGDMRGLARKEATAASNLLDELNIIR